MKRAILSIALVFVTSCSATTTVGSAPKAPPQTTPPATTQTGDTEPTTAGTSTPPPTTTTTFTTNTTPMTSTTTPTSPPPATTRPDTIVTSPGTYPDSELTIHVAFLSQVPDVTTEDFESRALAILNAPTGWTQSGFTFVADDASGLRVVLAEGPRVDELCLPLETFGTVSCQNGNVVALNADRWRRGARDWDSTVDAYRVYLVNHEVGHLIGLRHPQDRCPAGEAVSAVMEPQTNNLGSCPGNGIPLQWEIEWARNRPAVVGPTPDWDGPRPKWPTG